MIADELMELDCTIESIQNEIHKLKSSLNNCPHCDSSHKLRQINHLEEELFLKEEDRRDIEAGAAFEYECEPLEDMTEEEAAYQPELELNYSAI